MNPKYERQLKKDIGLKIIITEKDVWLSIDYRNETIES